MTKKCCIEENEGVLLLADFLRIISKENRLKIICYLQKNNELCVCEIQEFLTLPQNLVSHHLKVLKDFELLRHRKDGQKIYYSINIKELNKYRKILNTILS